MCGELYKGLSSLRNHMNTHHTPNSFDCDVCGRRFKRLQTLETHQRVHAGEKSLSRDTRRVHYHDSHALRNQSDVPSIDNPPTPDGCLVGDEGKALKKNNSVYGENKCHGCNACGKQFRSRLAYDKHKSLHCLGKNTCL